MIDTFILHLTVPSSTTLASVLEALVGSGFCIMRIDENGIRFQGPPNSQIFRLQVVSSDDLGDLQEEVGDALASIPHYGFVIYRNGQGDCMPGTA